MDNRERAAALALLDYLDRRSDADGLKYLGIEYISKVRELREALGEARAAIEGEVEQLKALPDDQIDTSDIPETGFSKGIRGRFLRAERVLEAAPQSTGFCNGRTSLCKDERCPICSGVRAAAPLPTAREELEQEYGQDHPWKEFDVWHKDFHKEASAGPIAWPCREPLRCLWRYTRKTGAILNQTGLAAPQPVSGPERTVGDVEQK